MSTYANTGLADVDTLLAQNSYVIDKAIYESHLYMSPWYTVFPKSALPVGVGNAMTSLIYDKSIPTVSAGGAVGVNWQRVGVGALIFVRPPTSPSKPEPSPTLLVTLPVGYGNAAISSNWNASPRTSFLA